MSKNVDEFIVKSDTLRKKIESDKTLSEIQRLNLMIKLIYTQNEIILSELKSKKKWFF